AVLLISSSVAWVAVTGILAMAIVEAVSDQSVPVWPFYVFTTLNAVASTVSGATRSAVTPRILPPHMVPRANALNGIAMGFQVTVGPAVAGVLVATAGFPITFAVDVVLFAAGFLGIIALPKLPPLAEAVRPGLESL